MNGRIKIEIEYVGKDGENKTVHRTAESFEIAEQNLESLRRMVAIN
jgi:hypothetical protein